MSVPHHAELGLGLLYQVVLLWLADAGKDAQLWVKVKHVALETGEEVAKTTDTAHAHDTLGEERGKGENSRDSEFTTEEYG